LEKTVWRLSGHESKLYWQVEEGEAGNRVGFDSLGQSKGKKKAAVSRLLWMCCSLFSLWEWSEIEGEIRLGRETHSLCQNR
jgi:hypothetical protein